MEMELGINVLSGEGAGGGGWAARRLVEKEKRMRLVCEPLGLCCFFVKWSASVDNAINCFLDSR